MIKGGGLAVDVAFFLRADRSLCGKAGTECRAHGGQTQSARHTNKCDIHNCIRTIGDLAKTDPDFLNRQLGKNGIALWQYANGNDRSRVMNADFVSPVKSVGHGITTIEDLENNEQVWPVFLELTQGIGHKLRVHKKCADGVAIHIRDNTLFSKQWQTALNRYIPDWGRKPQPDEGAPRISCPQGLSRKARLVAIPNHSEISACYG